MIQTKDAWSGELMGGPRGGIVSILNIFIGTDSVELDGTLDSARGHFQNFVCQISDSVCFAR